jgi:hypothetical protein
MGDPVGAPVAVADPVAEVDAGAEVDADDVVAAGEVAEVLGDDELLPHAARAKPRTVAPASASARQVRRGFGM